MMSGRGRWGGRFVSSLGLGLGLGLGLWTGFGARLGISGRVVREVPISFYDT
jgi:hypothetical protein